MSGGGGGDKKYYYQNPIDDKWYVFNSQQSLYDFKKKMGSLQDQGEGGGETPTDPSQIAPGTPHYQSGYFSPVAAPGVADQLLLGFNPDFVSSLTRPTYPWTPPITNWSETSFSNGAVTGGVPGGGGGGSKASPDPSSVDYSGLPRKWTGESRRSAIPGWWYLGQLGLSPESSKSSSSSSSSANLPTGNWWSEAYKSTSKRS